MSVLMISRASRHYSDTVGAQGVCSTASEGKEKQFILPGNGSAIGFVGADFLSCLSNSHTVQASSSLQGILKQKTLHTMP